MNGLFVLSLNKKLIEFNIVLKCILSREEGSFPHTCDGQCIDRHQGPHCKKSTTRKIKVEENQLPGTGIVILTGQCMKEK